MASDVQTLIAALTTERDSLDRAITALRAISPNGQKDAPVKVAPKARQRKVTRVRLTDDQKAEIVDAMTMSRHKTKEAARLARIYGARPNTIQTNWVTWARQLAAADQRSVPVSEPESVAVGVA